MLMVRMKERQALLQNQSCQSIFVVLVDPCGITLERGTDTCHLVGEERRVQTPARMCPRVSRQELLKIYIIVSQFQPLGSIATFVGKHFQPVRAVAVIKEEYTRNLRFPYLFR